MAVTATQHRLHCSGLGDDIDDEALAGRFKSFGAVQGVEIIRSSDGGCRGFGYVSLEASEESVAKCLKVYRGAKWRGRSFTVEPANPDFLTRLQTEWQEAAVAEAEAAVKLASKSAPAEASKLDYLYVRRGRLAPFVESRPGVHNRHTRKFPPAGTALPAVQSRRRVEEAVLEPDGENEEQGSEGEAQRALPHTCACGSLVLSRGSSGEHAFESVFPSAARCIQR